MHRELRIVLAGGGSGGPVAPLLAVAEEIKQQHPKAKFLVVGTKGGPEKQMTEQAGLRFASISAGKLRRYLSVKNLLSPVQVVAGFAQSVKLLREFKPSVAFGAGGFVQVPVLYAAKLLGVPVVIHQQDVEPSFANTLCAPIATKVTVSFEYSLKSFFQGSGLLSTHKHQKVVYTGNAFREELKEGSRDKAREFFKLSPDWPTLLVLGGGTGARFINQTVKDNLEPLAKVAQVIHVTGKGKLSELKHVNYQAHEFIGRMDLAYAAADLVVSRAGLSTLTELSNLGKVAIIIPMPSTHQEANAALYWHSKAALVLDQGNLDPVILPGVVKKLLFNHELQKTFSTNIKKIMPKDATKKIAEVVLGAVKI